MKILTPRQHGYLDYVTVVGFAVAPTVLELRGLFASIAYTLAIVHMFLTFVSAFPLGVLKLVPFKIHGLIELIVAVVLIALPWILHFADTPVPRNFYVGAGIVIFIVWLITSYRE
ncbi:MAG TPA: hypothetical protein VHL58_06425 [Thermoanaerobaculia bacterium]|nr:hypothetical protein [Thermoanaerobaculia bacterium]